MGFECGFVGFAGAFVGFEDGLRSVIIGLAFPARSLWPMTVARGLWPVTVSQGLWPLLLVAVTHGL